MNRNVISVIVIANVFILSCNDNGGYCQQGVVNDLVIEPVHTVLKIPPYRIYDSVIYYNGRTMLNYKITTIDSSLELILFVDDYKDYSDKQRDIEHIKKMQKQEVESSLESKITLITERYKQADSIKVGYVKYLIEQKNEKFYSARIFFYRDKRLVTIWLFENFINEKRNLNSEIECILNSLAFQ
ncbi:hypothetical protein A4H97_18780 [Niastella yeongjuensis]|uniref:Uncharacterized protein n=1 Tax=Niastella yeongjuensis TaxID=354355 RepID=A0A1V9DYC3_9BACT|nr:hypothetical protein [Niastella yeongjuensis]OQP38764.1 hypothetical protein A4H97_18780 [Niastella yeongjuensis]SEO33483.1 hypothetical protein SAMN05660816_02647 [Niastella yeongjuensis]